MSAGIVLALALGVFATDGPPRLPSGNDHFRLGMSRAQVDSAVAARGMEVISSGLTFIACRSDDPAVEYEQYTFFQAPHGMLFLWKVTIGYRLDASAADFAVVRDELGRLLGEPASETRPAGEEAATEPRRGPDAGQAIWTDPFTIVRLGAFWSLAPDRNAERMLVTWTDRRLQRLIEARRKRDRASQ